MIDRSVKQILIHCELHSSHVTEKRNKELCILSPPAKEFNSGISESAHFFFFACLIILLLERAAKFEGTAHLWKCK